MRLRLLATSGPLLKRTRGGWSQASRCTCVLRVRNEKSDWCFTPCKHECLPSHVIALVMCPTSLILYCTHTTIYLIAGVIECMDAAISSSRSAGSRHAAAHGPWGLNHARHYSTCLADTTLLAPRPSPGRQLRHCIESYARAVAVGVPVWVPHIAYRARSPINGRPLSPNGCHSRCTT